MSLPFVQLFSDGACRGNPGPGGWAYILRHPASSTEREGSGGETLTTNNQMELMAVIAGLEALKSRSEVEVITDSSYVAKGSSEWLPGWKRNGWIPCSPHTRCVSPGFGVMPATWKTNAATNSPSPRHWP